MKRKIIIPFAVLVLIAVDQLVKLYIVSGFKLGQVKSFIPHLVSLTYLQNTGAAFSMLENQQWLFTLVTFLVIEVDNADFTVALRDFVQNLHGC